MLKILDCTFRDGGYYNNWYFSKIELNEYIDFIKKNPINYIEIGFRFLKKNIFYGPFAFSSENFLRSLKLPKNKISVMINAKDYYADLDLVDRYFIKKNKSVIDLVRIAVNFDDYYKCEKLVKKLKKLGYSVGFNLMKANFLDREATLKIITSIKKWNCIDVLYFADSLGCMEADDVKKISKVINQYWKKDFGIHAHNNKGLAVSNTIQAINFGAKWVDSTILGMGRGAGNASTESLLIELRSLGYIKKINFSNLSSFHILKQKYQWGYNPYYHYSAVHKIHPSYVQTLIEDDRYDNNDIFNSLERLSKLETTNFNSNLLEEDFSIFYNKNYKSNFSSDSINISENVLVIGSGSNLGIFKDHVEKYIKNTNLTSFSLNNSNVINSKLINYYVVSHITRANIEIKEILKKKSKIIAPPAIIENFKIPKIKTISYGLKIDNNLKTNKSYCQLTSPLAISYCLMFLANTNIKKIYFAGIDGFEDQNKNKEINDFLIYFKNKYKKIELYSITPTKFSSLINHIIY